MDAIDRAIKITEAIVTLPPVPTHDWCDRAGAALSLARPGATALVGLLCVDSEGCVITVEVIGAARSGSDHWSAQGPDAMRHAGTRLSQVPRLGFKPDLKAESQVGLLSELCGRPEPVGPLATVISPIRDDPAVCLAPLPDGAFHRILLALVAGGVRTDEPLIDLLRATFPALARRAARALCLDAEGQTPWLTDRERLILVMTAAGHSAREIGKAIGRSHHTVNDHFKALHKKLGTSSRGELVARAFGQPELFSV